MPWIQVSVAVPGSEGEAAGASLEGLGAVAVTWCDAGDAPLFEPLPGALPDLAAWPEVRAVGLFGLDVGLDIMFDLPVLNARGLPWRRLAAQGRATLRRAGGCKTTRCWRAG